MRAPGAKPVGRRARALLAVAIAAVVLATVALPALGLLPPPWPWLAARMGYLALYAVAPGGGWGARVLTNASFSVWAFYPVRNGTIFQGIYNGTGEVAYVSLSSLRRWAEAWVKYYWQLDDRSFMPSLIVFVSYPIKVNTTTIEVVSQQFMVPLSPAAVIRSEGEVVGLAVDHPLRFYYSSDVAAGQKYGDVLGAAARLARMTTTTSTSVHAAATARADPSWLYTYSPRVLAWYPSNDSLGPISVAIAAAQPTRAYGAAGANAIAYVGLGPASFDAVVVSGSDLSAAVHYAETGAVVQAMRVLSPFIPGASLTFTQVSGVPLTAILAFVAASSRFPDVAQAYIVGQAALVNWTARLAPSGLAVGWQVSIMLTVVKTVESGGAVIPALYSWEAYDPCVNVTAWAREYEEAEFGGAPPSEANTTCPIPNTPAPVDWVDYAYNLTQIAAVRPGKIFGKAYTDFEVDGVRSPAYAALDAGSALVSAGAAAALAAGLDVPPAYAALVLAAVQVPASEMIVSSMAVINDFTNATLYAYISNMTPLYTSGSAWFTLPRELIFVNTSAAS